MSNFGFFSDMILAGLENVDMFTPVILIRLIGFMLLLEFVGCTFGLVADAVGISRRR